MSWMSALNEELKSLDRDLYAKEELGIVRVYRRHYVYDRYEVGSDLYSLPRKSDQHIISLTENWSYPAPKRSWGILPVIFRLKEIDQHNRDHLAEVERQNEIAQNASDNARKGMMEDMVRENASVYRRAFADVNTSGMDKRKVVSRKLNQF